MFNKISLFKNRDFRKLWTAHILSQLSGYGLLFLVISKTFELTGSSVITGIVYISFSLPMIFVSPFAGSLVDAWAKRKTLIVTYLSHFAIISFAALSFLSGKFDLIYFLLFLFSTVTAVNDPAELAQLPNVVKNKKDLMLANNIFFFTDQASLITASAITGLLVNFISFPITLGLVGLMPLTASLVISKLPSANGEGKPLSLIKELESLVKRIKAGYKFLSSNTLVLYSFGLVVIFRVLTSLAVLLLPNIANNIFNISAFDAGYFIILPVAVGLFVGTTILNKREEADGRKNKWIGTGFSLMGMMVLAVVFGRQDSYFIQLFLDLAYLVLIGVSASVIFAPSVTFLHEYTPNQVRGHTFANLMFFVNLAIIPSSLLATSLAELLGIQVLMAGVGLLILILGVIIINKGNEIILATNHRN
jgi:MFS family permease